MNYYFATDGNYGDATELIIVDTTNWSESDWQLIEDSHDSERSDVAQRISEERE
jgi:hypothetical protein